MRFGSLWRWRIVAITMRVAKILTTYMQPRMNVNLMQRSDVCIHSAKCIRVAIISSYCQKSRKYYSLTFAFWMIGRQFIRYGNKFDASLIRVSYRKDSGHSPSFPYSRYCIMNAMDIWRGQRDSCSYRIITVCKERRDDCVNLCVDQ